MRLIESWMLGLMAVFLPALAVAQAEPAFKTKAVTAKIDSNSCLLTFPEELSDGVEAYVGIDPEAGKSIVGVRLLAADSKSDVSVEHVREFGGLVYFRVKREPVEKLGKLKSISVKIDSGKEFECVTARRDPFGVFDEAKAESSEPSESSSDQFDGYALEYWLREGVRLKAELLSEQLRLGGPEKVRFIVHLPSGNLAPPVELSASEGDRLQFAFLMPAGSMNLPELNAEGCEDVASFRLKPTAESPGAKQSKEKTLDKMEPPSSFKLVPVGPVYRCGAGKMKYRISPVPAYAKKQAGSDPESTAENTFEVRIRPRYHLAVSLTAGYDFAKTELFEKQRSPSDPDTNVIAAVEDRKGIVAYLGAVWMIGGVDYEDMKWYNYFANLFVGVNPADPTDDIVFGLALTPTGSISLALGWSLHRGHRLGGGFEVGQAFTGDGDIPTEKSWRNIEHGPFIGLAIDSNIHKAIADAF